MTDPRPSPGAVRPTSGGYTLTLPWSRPPLTANQRLHWAQRASITATVRITVGWLATAAGIPRCEHIEVTLYWAPPDRRRRDVDNLVPTLKAACDGLVDAGIVPDDTPAYMDKHMPMIEGTAHPGLMWLVVTSTSHRPVTQSNQDSPQRPQNGPKHRNPPDDTTHRPKTPLPRTPTAGIGIHMRPVPSTVDRTQPRALLGVLPHLHHRHRIRPSPTPTG